jgi:hypothetical protein
MTEPLPTQSDPTIEDRLRDMGIPPEEWRDLDAVGRLTALWSHAERERERLRDALLDIIRHRDMPSGEQWRDAYDQVVQIADQALGGPTR